jgi:hypothetical protein
LVRAAFGASTPGAARYSLNTVCDLPFVKPSGTLSREQWNVFTSGLVPIGFLQNGAESIHGGFLEMQGIFREKFRKRIAELCKKARLCPKSFCPPRVRIS